VQNFGWEPATRRTREAERQELAECDRAGYFLNIRNARYQMDCNRR
jgi:hypothetical protein